ncbi:hypothetical protein HYALB_00007349 [Hymenoscyphus albidus]|uniref:Uncharacterized protein n=1 Tax=Hymenoscyphus albidus TaxID=595503 RepID=A0A9N9LKD9_9HELO|nr:hypothetical protein HYALB_00007349 [Hymenoscyphus albidus]
MVPGSRKPHAPKPQNNGATQEQNSAPTTTEYRAGISLKTNGIELGPGPDEHQGSPAYEVPWSSVIFESQEWTLKDGKDTEEVTESNDVL